MNLSFHALLARLGTPGGAARAAEGLKKGSPRRKEGGEGHEEEGKDGFEAEKPSGEGGLGGFAVGAESHGFLPVGACRRRLKQCRFARRDAKN